jgi:hypothetical protein
MCGDRVAASMHVVHDGGGYLPKMANQHLRDLMDGQGQGHMIDTTPRSTEDMI